MIRNLAKGIHILHNENQHKHKFVNNIFFHEKKLYQEIREKNKRNYQLPTWKQRGKVLVTRCALGGKISRYFDTILEKLWKVTPNSLMKGKNWKKKWWKSPGVWNLLVIQGKSSLTLVLYHSLMIMQSRVRLCQDITGGIIIMPLVMYSNDVLSCGSIFWQQSSCVGKQIEREEKGSKARGVWCAKSCYR